nr:beta-galactosidase [Bacteroidales bacterium]
MFKKLLCIALMLLTAKAAGAGEPFRFGTAVRPDGQTLYVDGTGILLNGEYVLPVMGEIHFSRVPERDWKREILKMQAGGIDIIACYIFWGHHEMEEGRIDWSGNRNLREFLEICRDCGEKVVLRVGPFCHGEVYLGGIPEWVVDKAAADPEQYALRTPAPGFIAAVSRFYDAIGRQAEGLLWKDGGPVIGVQVDNESSGPWPYFAALKKAIIAAGMDVPFYTRTGWPQMEGPAVFGEILPLYGDYADGFWDRELTDMPGDYPAAFRFKDSRLSAVIATEVFGTDQSTEMSAADLSYPYLTCELGGGMMTSYHRRIHIFDRDALALAICKVGSGSNLPGYYMYHGGTNPYCAEHSMAEFQASKYTFWNDLPHMTYDFQAPLGEMGQPNQSYHYLRLLHQMLRDWGGELAPMQPQIGSEALRTATRGLGGKGFVFVNNYERMKTLGEKKWTFFDRELTVPEGASFCFPYGMDFRKLHIEWATAQPFCKLRRALYFVAVEGIEPVLRINGREYRPRLDKPLRVRGTKIVVMSPRKALTAYKVSDRKVIFSSDLVYRDGRRLVRESWETGEALEAVPVTQAGPAREVALGKAGVAEQPSEADFEAAAVWTLPVPEVSAPEDWFLEIDYDGDVARVYADG